MSKRDTSGTKQKTTRTSDGVGDGMRALPEKVLAALAARLIRLGRMPSPGRLADALASSPPPEKPRKLARGPGEEYHRVFVSSSQREGSTLHQARAGLQSPAFHNLILFSNRLPSTNGGRNGLGFWRDGAEESRVVSVTSPDQIRQIAARLGKAANQKAVITFSTHPGGSDIAHVLTVPHIDVLKIADALQRHGIEHKTIVPDHERRQSEVHIIDVGGNLTPSVTGAARELAAKHEQHLGRAEYIGGDTVPEAHAAYDRILGGGQ